MASQEQIEAERQRLYRIVDKMLEELYEDDDTPSDLRLDIPVVLGVYVWTDEDGDEVEDVSIYSGTRRNFALRGILDRALERTREGNEGGWINDHEPDE